MPQQLLNERQLRILINTADEDLKRVFPNYSRGFLRSEKLRAAQVLTVEERIAHDEAKLVDRARLRETDRLYKAAVLENERLRRELELARSFPAVEARDVSIKTKPGEREATAIVLASDWHAEEEVTKESTNGLNEYNLEVFDFRSRMFFANTLKLLHKEAQAINIRNLVLGVLGDMISGSIHADLAESNLLGPMEAIGLVQDTLAGGIAQLLKETPKHFQITIVFKWGNHSRTTEEQRIQTEAEYSLEWLMSHSLAREFAKEPRVKVVREKALLSYVDVHGHLIRFLHGHAFKYGGGVGGMTIPVNKGIAEWDKGRQAYLTCFGHLHTYLPGPRFLANGSLIGFAPYSQWVKAAFEKPVQAFCLIDAKHGRTVQAPVLLEPA